MARTRSTHRCRECSAITPTWVGRCPGCGAWASLVEAQEDPRRAPGPARPGAVPLVGVDPGEVRPRPTGVGELDRVLGGGLVPGSVTLLGGEPGIGKSTLALQVARTWAASGVPVLYVSGEESAAQVQGRALRLGAVPDQLWVLPDAERAAIDAAVDRVDPELVVVDSVQTLHDPALGSAPGSVAQVREGAQHLVQRAKALGPAVLLVGHVTKDGALAGPRVLEHVVDTVLAFDGDRRHALRLLRTVKHRFGPTSEVGLFDMTGSGLEALTDPSGVFLADRQVGVAGSVVTATVEGDRPLLVEVQALVTERHGGQVRRSAQGLDGGRLALLVAVLEQRAGVDLAGRDVFALAVGGVRLAEPGADLALALALASASAGWPVRDDLLACGEIGLGGELRSVPRLEQRLAEAHRLGFHRAVVPWSAPPGPTGLDLVRVSSLAEAVEVAVGTPIFP
jgi:DNA repair protein RadA/Sms